MHLPPISQISPLVPLLGPHHVSSDYHGLQHNLSGGSFHPDSHSPQHSVIVINCRFGHDTTVFTNTFNKFELTSVRKAPTAQCCAQALDFTPLPVPRSSSDTDLPTRHASFTPRPRVLSPSAWNILPSLSTRSVSHTLQLQISQSWPTPLTKLPVPPLIFSEPFI